MSWNALIIIIIFSESGLVNSSMIVISSSSSSPPAFTPFTDEQTPASSPFPYLPSVTQFDLANIAHIIQDLERTNRAGNGLTVEDINEFQKIASISNQTLQSASAYLRQLAENYEEQKEKTAGNWNRKLQPVSNNRLWPADNPFHGNMKGRIWNLDRDDGDDSSEFPETEATSSSPTAFSHKSIKNSSNKTPPDLNPVVSHSTSSSIKVKLGFGIGIPLLVIVMIAVIFVMYRRRSRECLRRQSVVNTSSDCNLSNDCPFNEARKKGIGKALQNSSYMRENDKRNKLAYDVESLWLLEKSRLVVFHEMKLGSGAFCNVYKGAIEGLAPVCKVNPSLIACGTFKDCMCAVKMLPPFADDIARSDFMQEIKFMKSLKYHPHLVSMLGLSHDVDGNTMLLIEYCDLGDLLHLVRARKDEIIRRYVDDHSQLRIKDLVSFAWQISNGLEYLSSTGCVHRDVAARNVLVNAANVCKIGDFGLCRLSDSLIYTGRGGRLPLKWMAPESLRSYEYSHKTDVWSYGVLLYEVFSFGEVPYALLQTTEILGFLESGARLGRPERCPADIYTLMLQCWQYEAMLRPSFTEICSFLRMILEINSEQYGYVEAVVENSIDL